MLPSQNDLPRLDHQFGEIGIGEAGTSVATETCGHERR